MHANEVTTTTVSFAKLVKSMEFGGEFVALRTAG